jgi:hypothetical protein
MKKSYSQQVKEEMIEKSRKEIKKILLKGACVMDFYGGNEYRFTIDELNDIAIKLAKREIGS